MSDGETTGAASKAAASIQSASDAVKTGGEQARQAGADALGQAKDVAREAKSRASSALNAVTDQASSAAEAQKANLADRLEDVAKAVHKSGEQLESQSDWVAKFVEQGADELTSLAGTLRNNDLQSLLGNLKDLAGRQPALFVGASMAVGFALTRVGLLAAANPSQPVDEPKPTQFSAGTPTVTPTTPGLSDARPLSSPRPDLSLNAGGFGREQL